MHFFEIENAKNNKTLKNVKKTFFTSMVDTNRYHSGSQTLTAAVTVVQII